MAPLLRLQAGSLAFGHVPLLDSAELAIEPKERVCLIGRNGTGKSTLLNVLHGTQVLDGGQLWRRDGLHVTKLAQEVPAGVDASLFDTVAAGLGDHAALLARFHAASQAIETGDPEALAAFADIQAEVEHANAWDSSQRVDAVLSRLQLTPDARLQDCSGGLRRRAMLGQAIVSQPDVLLLDEPTNHLDIESISALEDAVASYPGAVLFITHDRAFIDRLATRIVELDRGILRSYPGSYAEYTRRKAQQLAAEADAERKFDTNLAAEEVWIRQGIKARRTRNEGRVRRLEALRKERSERRSRAGNANLKLERSEASGKLVLEATDVSFAYPDADPLLQRFSTTVLRGDRIGIIGPNGSGKSTLLKLLLGELTPSTGSIRTGSRLDTAYFDQERGQLDLEKSVRDNVADGSDRVEIGGKSRHVVGYLGDFLFPPARVNSPVKTLSGGERNRLLLAKLFTQPANLLILDEPTNDLDIETLELLEELLMEYTGTLLLVSHDRSFIDRTVTSTLVIGADGKVSEHVGGYSDWHRYAIAQRPAATAQAASTSGKGSAAQPTSTATTAVAAENAADTSKRLSYKERKELSALPGRIEKLETQQAELQAQSADPAFYQRPQAEVAEAMRQLAAVEDELAAAYERWEALEG